MSTTVTNSSSAIFPVTEWIEPKMIIPTEYTATISSADHHYFFGLLNSRRYISPKSEFFASSPPSPHTVKVKDEKDSVPEKDSYWLGW
jgi:hypothetical protein